MAMFCGDTFRMKLNAMDVVVAMAQAHDDPVIALGGDFKAIGETFPLHCEGVIARGPEAVFQTGKDRFLLMADLAQFAVHGGRLHNFSTIYLANGLVTEANA